MVSDDINIYTRDKKEKKCRMLMIRNLMGEYLMREDASPDTIIGKEHGTTIELMIRPDIDMSHLLQDLRDWIVIPQVNVSCSVDDGSGVAIGYTSTCEVIEEYITKYPLYSTGKLKAQIKTYKKDGLEISCLLVKNEIWDCWSIASADRIEDDEMKPWGVSVEGIKVTNATPGFTNTTYVAFANFTGENSPTTNVARNGFEDSISLKQAYANIYNTYFDILLAEMDNSDAGHSIVWGAYVASFLLNRFTIRRLEEMDNLSNKVLFDECLAKRKSLIVDNGHEYKLVSLDSLSDVVFTIGGNGYDSANRLLQDCNATDRTALSILQSLKGITQDVEMEVVNVANMPIRLRNAFIRHYSIQEITVDAPHRQTIMKWVRKESQWKLFKCYSSYARHVENVVFPLNCAEVNVNGLSDEVAVRTTIGLVMNPKTELAQFIALSCHAQPHAESILEIFADYIPQLLKNDEFDDVDFQRFFKQENPMGDALWDIIDKDRLLNVLKGAHLKVCDFDMDY